MLAVLYYTDVAYCTAADVKIDLYSQSCSPLQGPMQAAEAPCCSRRSSAGAALGDRSRSSQSLSRKSARRSRFHKTRSPRSRWARWTRSTTTAPTLGATCRAIQTCLSFLLHPGGHRRAWRLVKAGDLLHLAFPSHWQSPTFGSPLQAVLVCRADSAAPIDCSYSPLQKLRVVCCLSGYYRRVLNSSNPGSASPHLSSLSPWLPTCHTLQHDSTPGVKASRWLMLLTIAPRLSPARRKRPLCLYGDTSDTGCTPIARDSQNAVGLYKTNSETVSKLTTDNNRQPTTDNRVKLERAQGLILVRILPVSPGT